MSALMNFLLENPVDHLTTQVVISERLKEYPFTIRAMSGAEFADYQRLAVVRSADRKAEFNTRVFHEQIIVNQTVEPNFKDAAVLSKAGCSTPEQLVNKTLLAGEIARLAQKITALSGFGDSLEELADEAKNS